MPALKKYPDEMRERASRLVRDKLADTPGLSVTRGRRLVGEQLGINPDTLRNWVKQARIDLGEAPGTTSSCTTQTTASSTSPSPTPNACRAPASKPPSAPSETATTTPPPKP